MKNCLESPFLLPMDALTLQSGCQEAALQGGLCWAQQGAPCWRRPRSLLTQKEGALCNQWGAKIIIGEPSKEGISEPALPHILPPPPMTIVPGHPGCAPQRVGFRLSPAGRRRRQHKQRRPGKQPGLQHVRAKSITNRLHLLKSNASLS